MDAKRSKYLEKVIKGASNHWRLKILDELDKKPELSVGDITEKVKGDYRTISDHIRKLAQSGLVMKRYEGNSVRHALTNRGKSILKFCKILE